MKGAATKFSSAEMAWIEAHRHEMRPVAHARFCDLFGRQDVALTNYSALCKRRGWFTGRTGRFVPGQVAVNKGQKMPFNPNSAATQFKKGMLPANTRHLGHERISSDGYVHISVDQVNPHTGYARRYVLKHRWLWEQAHGPVPDGMCLKRLDGDRTNTDPSNWECIPRALLPRLDGRFGRGFETAEPEVKPVLLTIAKVEQAACDARRARKKKLAKARVITSPIPTVF